MADPLRAPARSVRWRVLPAVLATAPGLLLAQSPEASYPVDPVAAAGMTSGLPNAITSRQVEMMQVRTSAQSAQGDAAAASMARSADQSIEERNRDAALQAARTNKAIKDAMRNRLRFEAASAQHHKVSANDMSTWQQNGGVRVERNVPNAFISSLIAEEEQAAARAAASGGRKRFSLFGGDDEPSDGIGFLGAIRPPRLPFIGGGGGNDDEGAPTMAAAPPPSDNSEPVFAPGTPGRSSSPTPSAPAGTVPRISGAALVDGRSPVGSGQSSERPSSSSRSVSFSEPTPEPERRRPGLFSRSDSEDEDSLVPTSRESGRSGGGLFSFGRKKVSAPAPGIDASLFPAGSVDQAPRGGRLSGGATAADVADDFATESSSTGSFSLPGRTVEKERSGFSLPKPSLSLPSLPSVSVPSLTRSGASDGGSTSPGTYVVSSTAQFMVYGADQMQSEIRALPAGTAVMVTKPGEQWSGIQLPDGTEGVVQNKNLRPASR